jgi:hypothetical protein
LCGGFHRGVKSVREQEWLIGVESLGAGAVEAAEEADDLHDPGSGPGGRPDDFASPELIPTGPDAFSGAHLVKQARVRLSVQEAHT